MLGGWGQTAVFLYLLSAYGSNQSHGHAETNKKFSLGLSSWDFHSVDNKHAKTVQQLNINYLIKQNNNYRKHKNSKSSVGFVLVI